MDREIRWNSGVFDEIGLVYDKAEQSAGAAQLLLALEAGALAEAQKNSRMISLNGRAITPEEFDTLPDFPKEQLIAHLAEIGLEVFSANISSPKITIRLSPVIQSVLNCTAFSILNRLEKLDGAMNVLHPKVELEIQAPIGGKKGLVFLEMLITLLYPWLNVREVSSDVIAATPMEENGKSEEFQIKERPKTQNLGDAFHDAAGSTQNKSRFTRRNIRIVAVIILLVSLILLFWDVGQRNKIEEGTIAHPLEITPYCNSAGYYENREAKVLGLITFGKQVLTEASSNTWSTKTTAYYCIAILEDHSIGAVKLRSREDELTGYDQWLIETVDDMNRVLSDAQKPLTLTGVTTPMPVFEDSSLNPLLNGILGALGEGQESALDGSLQKIPLLDTTGALMLGEASVPNLPTLADGLQGVLCFLVFITVCYLAIDIRAKSK